MPITTFDRTRLTQGVEIITPWVELILTSYPTGGSTTQLWSDRNYADEFPSVYGGYKSGQVVSFGHVGRSLSGWRDGQVRAASFGFTIQDNPTFPSAPNTNGPSGPGLLGQLLNDPNYQFWYNRQATMRVSTWQDKLGGTDPLVLGRGFITQYGSNGRFQFQFGCDDSVTSEFSAFNPQKKLPARLVGTAQFADCPAENRGFPEPIIYGEVTDAPTTNKGAIPLLYVGTEVISAATWSRFLVCGHAMSTITGWFAGGVPVDPATAGVTWLVPGYTGYPGGVKYRDIGGRRYTIVYVRGPDADNHISGTAPLTINGKGTEDVGDGTGTLIDDVALQYLHFLINYVFQNYLTGGYLAVPGWSALAPTVFKVNQASFFTVRDQHHARLAFPYYRGGGVMGPEGQTSVRDAIAQWNLSCDVQCGFNKVGEFVIFTDDAIATVADYDDVNDIDGTPIALQPDPREIFNEIPYVYSPSYTAYQAPLSAMRSCQGSKDAYAIRRLEQELILRWVRDNATAQDIADHWAKRQKDPARLIQLPMPWTGANREIGDWIRVTHNDYGWALRTFRIEGIDIDVDNGLVMLLCRDMTATVIAATTTAFAYDSRTGLAGTFSAAPDSVTVTIAAAVGALPCGGSMHQGVKPTAGTYVDVEEYIDVDIDWAIFASFNAYFRIDAKTQDAGTSVTPSLHDRTATGGDTVDWHGAATTSTTRATQTITVTKPPSGGVHTYRLQVTRGSNTNAFVYANGVAQIAP